MSVSVCVSVRLSVCPSLSLSLSGKRLGTLCRKLVARGVSEVDAEAVVNKLPESGKEK